ncbi:alpha/beta fold hydrolase, partial [Ancylomarina sp. 16SWW S1-10-2]|nr:alpha/beta fold hydrolase [Ancylomarina sp. 16SWW S1-10-2]
MKVIYMKSFLFILFFIAFANIAETQVLTNTNKFSLVKEIPLKKYKNDRYTLRADVKNVPTDSTGLAELFLLQVGKGDYDFIESSGQTKRISSRDTSWTSYSISGRIKQGAERIWVYLQTEGNGDCYFDNLSFKVEINDSIWTENLFREGNFESVSNPIKIFSNSKYIEVNKDKKLGIALNNGVGYGKSLHLSIKNNQQFLQYRCGYDSSNGKYVKSNNTKIYYEVYGKGDPLLLLHGNGQSISAYSRQIPEFAKHFKVIAVDTRGQGKSIDTISKNFSYNQFSEDMKVLLDTLHLKQVNLVGWSDGGNTGLTL